MKITLVGLVKNSGVSKKTNNPYSIPALRYLTDADSFESKDGSYKRESYGQELTELNVSEDLFNKLKTQKMPCNCELIFETSVYNGKPVVTVSDVKINQ